MKTAHVPVTLAMILKDSESGIRRALDSAAGLYDELVVVMDSRSSDDTERIVREEYGAKVRTREWTGFSDQRNESIRMASHDWIFILDGDEYVSNQGNLRAEIDAAHAAKFDAVFVGVRSVADGGKTRESEKQIRAFRADRCRYIFPVHNQLRGWRRDRLSLATTEIVATYEGDLSDRFARAVPALEKMLAESKPGSSGWQHAQCFLARSHAMVSNHAGVLKHGRELLENAPDHIGFSGIWPVVLRSIIMAEGADAAWEFCFRALKHHPGMPDLWWWAMVLAADHWAKACCEPGAYGFVPQMSTRFVANLETAGPMLGLPVSFKRQEG